MPLSRSEFLLSLLGAPLFAQNSGLQKLDILIRNGSLYDGSGTAATQTDIGISGDRIAFLGKNAGLEATRVIDADGFIVAPGFIDPHTHTLGDLSSPQRKRNDPYLMQGVATVVTGNDGDGPAEPAITLQKWKWQGIGTNAALYVGQGAVRRQVMGMSDAAPTPQQLAQMKNLVGRAMQQGAIGMSTGLYYAPGSYATTEEVIALAKMAAAHGGLYDTHMRDEDSYSIGLVAAVQETIRIGREAGLPVHISHIKALGKRVWGKSTEVIAIIDAARAQGVKITASQYPYIASGTSVTASLIPRWAEVGGSAALLKRIGDPSVRPRLIAEMSRNLDNRGGPASLLMTASKDKQIVGKTLAQVAQEHNETPIDAALEIVKAGGSAVASFNMNEDDIKNFMRQNWVMTCSDGSVGHPRKYGTFPRKLRKYVFDEHVITLPFAIRSMTSLPAATLGLKDRGVLKTGCFADVLVFDPKTIRDLATFANPKVLSTGIRYLLVNGKLAVDNGRLTDALSGRCLQHSS
jgi:N-acyl-D-aspartate/D-glutamate deacylase